VSGTILNALDGMGVPAVNLTLRRGINVSTGSTTDSVATGSDGTYRLDALNAGHYTAEATVAGFTTLYFPIRCVGGSATDNQDGTMTPTMSGTETRFVLTWGARPNDLDSHLTGPRPGMMATERFHIYYGERSYSEANTIYTLLDHDDTSAYGPETVTVRAEICGVYRYSILDFSNQSDETSTALSLSGATVQVYRASTMVTSFHVPSNRRGNLWTVFEMLDGVIAPINRVSFLENTSELP
jgi:hypothetical protein